MRKLDGYKGTGTFPHGIHPPDRKQYSKEAAIEVMPTPKKVVLPLHQNIGGPCEQLVKPRQAVAWGELIGKGKIFVSTTLHASVPGVIQRPARVTLANGRHDDGGCAHRPVTGGCHIRVRLPRLCRVPDCRLPGCIGI